MAKSSNINLFDFKKNAKHSKKLSFASSLWPFYFCLRIYGLFPFSVKFDSNGEVQRAQVSWFDLLWFVLTIVFYLCVAAVYFQMMEFPQDPSASYILFFGDSIFNLVGLIFGVIIIVMDMCNRSKLVDILRRFNAFDKELKRFGIEFDYKGQIRRIILWYMANIIVVFLLTLSLHLNVNGSLNISTKQTIIYFYVHMLQFFFSAAVVSTYCSIIFRINDRFDIVNCLLKKQFLNRNTIILRKDKSIVFIKHMGRLHNMLCGIMDKLNFCYSFQVMTSIGSSFMFTILTNYSFYRYIIHRNAFFEKMTRIHFPLQIFFSFYAYVVIYSGSLVAREGKKTSKILHNIINHCNDADVSSSLAQVSLQILHRYPVASCGLFTFNWTLLYSMIGAAATYLTILVQFDSPYIARNTNETSI